MIIRLHNIKYKKQLYDPYCCLQTYQLVIRPKIIILFSLNKMNNIGRAFQTPIKNQQRSYYVNQNSSNQNRNANQYPFGIRRVEVSEYIPYKQISFPAMEQDRSKREKSTTKKLSIASRLKTQKTEKKQYLKVTSQQKSMSKKFYTQQDESQIANQENYVDSQYKINAIDSHFGHFSKEAEDNLQILKKSQEKQILENVEEVPKDKLKAKKKIILSSKKSKHSSKTQMIPQAYRYCIGCLNPVLQVNIKPHQQSCQQFQKIFNLNEQQLNYFLKDLIQDLSIKLKRHQQQLSYQDVQNLNLYTNDLLYQTEKITQSGLYNSQYASCLQEIKAINKKWLTYAEQICKINWFITLHQRIKNNSFKK